MSEKYCTLCERKVQPIKRKTQAGDIVGIIIMVILGFVFPITIVVSLLMVIIWVISNQFAKKNCPICGTDKLK